MNLNTRTARYRRIAVIVAVFAISAAGGTLYWQGLRAPQSARAERPSARAPVPVSIAIASRRDVPVYLTGLGAVQASITVDIRSQVDGKLQEVLFTEGQNVKKGDVLARIDPRLFEAALDQAKAKKAQDAAMLVAGAKDLARAKTLAARGFGSQQNVDQQQAKVDQLNASVEADAAAVATAQTQLDYTTIVAPSGGRIGVRRIDPGNLVRASDTQPIVTLVALRPAAVLFTLPARYLDDVRDAMARGPVEVTAFDQDNRRLLGTGKLLLIESVIDQASSTIRLKALFANNDERLWPGEFVNAQLLLETRRDALVIPSAAVQRGPQGLFAWLVTATNIAEPRPIEVGPAAGALTIVTTGLDAGERVVTDGQYKLQAGAPVAVTETVSGGAK
jgi:membrane fusion protein, multidrug efflux system